MKVTRVKIRDSNISVHVFSGTSEELMMLGHFSRFIATHPTKYQMFAKSTDKNDRTLIINDELFPLIKGLDLSDPVDLCVDSHIKKWNIETTFEKKPRDTGERFKIEVE